jgi:hypothetical protein
MTSRLIPPTNTEILEKIQKMQIKIDKLMLRAPTSSISNALSDVKIMLLQAQLILTEAMQESNVYEKSKDIQGCD